MADARWEYRLELIDLVDKENGPASRAATVSALNSLGRDGWEAVTFSPSHASSHGLRVETTQYVVLFKRRER